ncbi:MAG: hypothetical protein Q9194_007301 [Teloschistes cf. exilis]
MSMDNVASVFPTNRNHYFIQLTAWESVTPTIMPPRRKLCAPLTLLKFPQTVRNACETPRLGKTGQRLDKTRRRICLDGFGFAPNAPLIIKHVVQPSHSYTSTSSTVNPSLIHHPLHAPSSAFQPTNLSDYPEWSTCDEQRPECTQCTTTNRLCPGYTHLFDLVLRDQTKSVSLKAQQRKNKKQSASNLNNAQDIGTGHRMDIAEWNNSLQPSGRVPPRFAFIATNATTGYRPLPITLHEPPEQQAVNAFISNYVSISRHSYSSRGYLDFLLPLYQNTRHDSLLSLATTAVALAIEGGSARFQHYRDLSHSYFGKALLRASKAIRDPVESIKDDTLMSVLLLSFYERVLAVAESKQISGVHDSGAVALVKHRGKQNGNSELSARLLLAAQTQVVSFCAQ